MFYLVFFYLEAFRILKSVFPKKKKSTHLHYLNFNELLEEKARWELHWNTACFLNQSWKQHSTSICTANASHLKNHSNKTNKICSKLQEKQGQSHKRSFPVNPNT